MAYNANSNKVYKPYRKASEYLTSGHRAPAVAAPKSTNDQEVDVLRQKLLALTRKLEHAETEYSQSREYLENQADLANDKLHKITEQYKQLQSSYVSQQALNHELEEKVAKINRLEAEKASMDREINDLHRNLTDTRNALLKTQEENERLRKDCNLAVQLLKCNQSSYQTQKPEQLPQELHERVASYKVELQDYNEYINPYADADSDSESEERSPQKKRPVQGEIAGVSVDLLARVLEKPENVHMNLEASDYIRDPQLTSTYKARYTERKLIKPDYGDADKTFPKHPASSVSSTSNSISSPWEVAQQPAPVESSPWELAPRRPVAISNQYEDDDEAPAGAYGAYAVGPRRRPRRFQQDVRLDAAPKPVRQVSPVERKDPVRNNFAPSVDISPEVEDIEFRKPVMHDAYVASSFFARSSGAPPKADTTPSSTSSSRKSSPMKVRGKEIATNGETSSLLTRGSDDDDEQHASSQSPPSSATTSPKKSYLAANDGVEQNALLADEAEPNEYRDDVAVAPPVDLEWDDEAELVESPEPPATEQSHQPSAPEPTEPEPNLLLSYQDVEAAPQQRFLSLDDFLASGDDVEASTAEEADSPLTNNLLEQEESSPVHLLSEIVLGNPSIESFLMSPPPPLEFAVAESVPVVAEVSTLTENLVDVNLDRASPPVGVPRRVDEEVEVIDLDEEPKARENRRRNSFDKAREYGNVMD